MKRKIAYTTALASKSPGMGRLLPGAVVALLLALGVAGCSAAENLPGVALAGDEAPAELEPLEASGFIEAKEVSVVSEVSGRVAEVLVDEADPVEAGQVVVVLDDALLQADRARAEAAVAVARANLAKLLAGADQAEIDAAEAALEEAQAQLEGAQRAYWQALDAVNNPRTLDVQIASTEMQVSLAQQQIEAARAQLEQERIKLDWLNHADPRDELAIEFQEYAVRIAEANLQAAIAQYEGAQHELELLQNQRERPLPEIARAHQARTQMQVAEARIDLLQAQYDLLVNGALPEEVAIAQAQVDAAEAQVALIDAQISRLTLKAPIDGTVTTRAIAPGETASPGVPLLTIADLSVLKLVVYIPETQIGRVQLGAPVEISVDAYPGETFEGEVTYISREAEFTPRNVQTEEERVNLVFAVEIRIDNTDGRLRPGMPADAVIEG
ncbi:MAG TPA: HlyD family efflux transporter periplasmic adaptor subunit [Chloroflexi bacterium]|nr:HlyD family efflux transporter periplasmic adaptor subunit [Chloroflexota bacterium]